MKKKTYVWLAFLLLMLVATLTSCEKFALDDSGTNSHDANANVIIHASVAKTILREQEAEKKISEMRRKEMKTDLMKEMRK